MFKKAFVASLPVMAGYIVLGIGFGMVLESHGYGPLWALLMSVCIYAGSMQYVTVDLIAGGAGILTAVLTTLAVNARHIFYGISMVDKYRGMKHKPLLIWTLTDETYSIVCGKGPEQTLGLTGEDPEQGKKQVARFCLIVGLLNYSYWVTGSVLGGIIGTILPISTKGIDFSLTALFITVFVEQWLTTKNHLAALIGLAASLLCLLLFGSDAFLIPAMVLIAVLLLLMRKNNGITNESKEVHQDD